MGKSTPAASMRMVPLLEPQMAVDKACVQAVTVCAHVASVWRVLTGELASCLHVKCQEIRRYITSLPRQQHGSPVVYISILGLRSRPRTLAPTACAWSLALRIVPPGSGTSARLA